MPHLLNVILLTLAIDTIVTGLLTVILYKRHKATKIKAVFLATLFFAFDLLLAFVELIFVIFNSDNLAMIYLDLDQPFPILFSTLGILGAGTFLLFINYYLREETSMVHVAVIFSILFSFLTFTFMKLYLNYHEIVYPSPSVTNTPISFEFLPAVLITYLLIVTVPPLIKLRNKTQIKQQKRVVTSLLACLIFYYVNTSIFITLNSQLDMTGDTSIVFSSVLPRTTVIIGDFIMFLTYARIPAGFLHDQRIEKLLIISKSGTLIYSQDFISDDETLDSDILLSGGLSALSSMLAETIGVTQLESIEFKEKEVLISHFPAVGFFLITDRPSSFLWNALSSVSIVFSDLTKLASNDLISEKIINDEKITFRVNEIFGVSRSKSNGS